LIASDIQVAPEPHGGLVRNGSETVLLKCFAGYSVDDMLTEFRARWLWDDRETTAQRQQHPVKPVAAEPARSDPAAMALRPLPHGAYETTGRLPRAGDDGQFEYRIKHSSDSHERRAKESELSLP
jgi:hypothetical protein